MMIILILSLIVSIKVFYKIMRASNYMNSNIFSAVVGKISLLAFSLIIDHVSGETLRKSKIFPTSSMYYKPYGEI